MNKYSKYLLQIIAVFVVCLLSACQKENTKQSAPSLKMLSVSATELTEFSDSLVIELEYVDEDGDLGEIDPDVNALYVKDRRLSEADYYFVQPLSPPGSSVKIKGVIAVQMKNTFLLGTGNSEQTQFDIKIKDQAGHWSNTVSTPIITILKKP